MGHSELTGELIPRHLNVRVIAKDNLETFLGGLREFGEVFGPVEKERGAYIYAQLTDVKNVVQDAQRTVLPPKKYLYPQKEELFRFSTQEGYRKPESVDKGRKILFGVHPCDIHGLSILDKVFAGRYHEPRYFDRRDNLIIIGMNCLPDERCFCYSMGTDWVEKGFDLFLTELEDSYFVKIGTSCGEDLVHAQAELFRPVTDEDIQLYKERVNERNKMFVNRVELANLAQILELEYESEVWEELGRKCLSCGACSAVCPTCYCYEVYDVLDLNVETGSRIRRWDACLFKDFAKVAGGHNFREERSTRVKHRFYHKQVTFVEEFGRPSCVGCGRCVTQCPAGINLIDVFKEIRGEKVVHKSAR